MNAANKPPARLAVEPLERREVPSVASAVLTGSTLVVSADDTATQAEFRPAGADLQVRDLGAGRHWTFPAGRVSAVQFKGGAAADRFTSVVPGVPVRADGRGGNDVLTGCSGADVLTGGAGDDTLIAVDDGTADRADGGAGRDGVWVDKTGAAADRTDGATAGDAVQAVDRFVGGDRTLDGDALADPLAPGRTYRSQAGKPLYAAGGPAAADVRQGGLGDCWLLAGLGAIALDGPTALRQGVVDLDDGTFGVKLGGKFYRVDADLPGYAGLGREDSLWVAVTEKAFAMYRSARFGRADSYANLSGGWGVEVNEAFGSAGPGFRSFRPGADPAELAGFVARQFEAREAVTVGFLTVGTGVPIVARHMYTIVGVTRDGSGAVTAITVRNPWGVDGGGSRDANPTDGLVTLTPAQLAACSGAVNWGRVSQR